MSDRWKRTTIAECLVASFAGEWGADPVPGNTVVYRATDIDDEGRIVGAGAARRLPIGKLTSKMLKTGDILLEGSGGGPGKPVGRVAYFDSEAHGSPATCSNFFKTLRPSRDQVDPRFLLQKLLWFYKQPPILALQQQTTGIINLKFEEYLASQVEIPELVSEQAKIAEILDTLDTAIHEAEALIAKLKAVKQGLLHDLLTRGIDANGELRPPQSEAPHLYQPSLLGMIPVDWNCLRLESLVSSGCPITYGVVQPGPEIENGVPFIRGGDIFDGRIAVNQLRTISRAVSRSYARTQLQGGELLMSLVGYPGEVGIVPDDLVGANIARQAALISLPSPTLTRFVMHYLLSIAGKKQVLGQSLGSAQQVVNLGDLRGVRILLPNDEEMKEISRRVDSIDTRLHKDLDLLSKLVQSKVALMDDLLTGRVRVTPLLTDATA